MEKLFRVNGRIFTDKEEALAYEEELKVKEREKEEKQRKESDLIEFIGEHLNTLQDLVKDYERITGKKTYFVNDNGKLKLKTYPKDTYSPFSLLDDMFPSL